MRLVAGLLKRKVILLIKGAHAFRRLGERPFNPDEVHRVPPDLAKAQLHADCNRFGKRLETGTTSLQFCQCCLNFKSPPYDLNTPSGQLDSCGSYIPIFFLLIRFLRLYFSALAVLALIGLSFTVTNNCKRNSRFKHCGLNLATLTDIRERETNDRVFFYVQYALRYLPFVFGFLMVHLFFKKSSAVQEAIQKTKLTAASYTIMLEDIAPENESKEYIENYLNSLMRANGNGPVEVVKVNICNHELPLQLLECQIELKDQQRKSYQKQIELSRSNGRLVKSLSDMLASAEKEHKKLSETFEAMKGDSGSTQQKSGAAFVSLKTAEQVKAVDSLNTLWSEVRNGLQKFMPCILSKKHKHLFSKAMEPTDVVWENICLSSGRRTMYSILQSSLLLVLLAVAILLQGIAIDLQVYLQANPSKHFFQAFGNQFEIELANILGSVICAATSHLIQLGAEASCSLSRNPSKSAQQHVLYEGNKNVLVINNLYPIAIYMSLGQSINITKIIVYNEAAAAAIDLLTVYFDPTTMYQRFRAFWIKKKMLAGTCFDVTQKEFNELCTPPDLQILLRKAFINRTILIGSFVAYFSPLCIFIYFIYYLLLVPALKKKLITDSLKPEALEASNNKRMVIDLLTHTYIGILSRTMILQHLGLQEASVKELHLAEFALFILLLYLTPALYHVYRKRSLSQQQQLTAGSSGLTDELHVTDQKSDEQPTFDQAADNFEFDYDRCNPVTSRKTVQLWVQKSILRQVSKSSVSCM